MIRGLFFDLNGTLIDILTNEWDDNVWRVTANFLDYNAVHVSPEELREFYFAMNRQQRRESGEEYPEFDAVAIFQAVIERFGTGEGEAEPGTTLAECGARVFRASSRYKLQLYPGVVRVLDQLQSSYRLLAVSDGQALWAWPEMRSLGLDGYFSDVLISSSVGYRKPDRRMFEHGLNQSGLNHDEVIFIGNDVFRDVYGAKKAGMKTVFFKSNQGDHKPREFEPDYIIYNFSELPEAIRFLS